MRREWIMIGVLAQLGGCCHTKPVHPSNCEELALELTTTIQAASIALHRPYGESPPPDLDANAYLAAAKAYPLADGQIKLLRSVELEVWTKAECSGAIVVARCPGTKRVILADDTESTSRVDYPNLLGKAEPQFPARPPAAPVCPPPPPPSP